MARDEAGRHEKGAAPVFWLRRLRVGLPVAQIGDAAEERRGDGARPRALIDQARSVDPVCDLLEWAEREVGAP
jgi:hypothetical protein